MSSNVKDHPRVPQSIEEISPSWISEILGVKISEQDFHLESNVHSGSGFLSNMGRLRCKSEEGGTQSFNLIVKLLPEDENMRALVISNRFDNTEINFYKIVAPDLIQLLPDLEPYLCHLYYGHIQPEDTEVPYCSVLVIEDLKPKGYYTISFAMQESQKQINDVLEFMAKFHAAGVILEERKKMKLSQMYDFFQTIGSIDEKPMYYEMAKSGFEEVQNILSKNNCSPEIISAYKKLSVHSDWMISKIETMGREFPVLCHSDLWSNNVLFCDDSQHHHTKIIDFQILGYRDSTYDAAITILSSIPMNELKKEIVLKHLQHYYKAFAAECDRFGCPKLVKRTWEEFSEFFSTWGLALALLWFVMTSEPFASNMPKLVKIYEFLSKEMNVPDFLLSQI